MNPIGADDKVALVYMAVGGSDADTVIVLLDARDVPVDQDSALVRQGIVQHLEQTSSLQEGDGVSEPGALHGQHVVQQQRGDES